MDRAAFEALVDRALEQLPAWVLDALDNVIVTVEDRPNAEQDPHGEDILGIYEGVSLHDRGFEYTMALPDRIVIFRLPHLSLGLPVPDLEQEIRATVLHEIAHHLGIDDDRLHELGWD
ncbi:MAG: metallopeptidase family protein [Acidimicrobiia bacterium]|jgi:predicted Zn-dependent protease with MMP-like domain|nr:metallopeptidase family protein [Acidimicrobiia bacterium]